MSFCRLLHDRKADAGELFYNCATQETARKKKKNYNDSRISTSVRIALTEYYLTHFLIQQAFSAINESNNWIILSFQNLFYCICFRLSYRVHRTCIVYTEQCILCNYTASEAMDTAVLQADSNVLIPKLPKLCWE